MIKFHFEKNEQGLSGFLNERQSVLDRDFVSANSNPNYYDTDIENFWTNDSKTFNRKQFYFYMFKLTHFKN